MIGWFRFLAPDKPTISAAGARDAAAIAAIHARSFNRGWSEQEIEQLLLDRAIVADRALEGRKLVGFILSRVAADEAEILSVAVDPRRRNQGLAGKLLHIHLGRLAAHGVKAVFLEVDAANDAARKLYARAGFKEAGQRAGYYAGPDGARATALVLRRDLA